MIKIAICDDDIIFCHDLENKILSINEHFEVDVYFTLKDLSQKLDTQISYDLLFLDIEFGTLSGIRMGEYIRDSLVNDFMQIVFVSSKTSYAMELFKIRPLDFLIKPLKIQDIGRVINKAIEVLDKGNTFFIFQKNNALIKIKQKDIIYFASSARKVFVHMKNDSFWIYEKLDNLQKQMEGSFLRIHKSYLVNYNYIQRSYHDRIQLTNDVILPISKSRRIDIKKFLLLRN